MSSAMPASDAAGLTITILGAILFPPFCARADYSVIVVGGLVDSHVGLPNANIFNPGTESWTALPNMSYARWYPTATMNSDGTIIVSSGETNCDGCDAPIDEIYNESSLGASQR